MGVINVTDSTFESEVLQSSTPVLVDFWAEWCGPCKMIAPIVDEISDELAEKIKVAKVNVDEAQQLAGKYGIMSIPTLLLFKDGELIDQLVGAMSKESIISKIEGHVR